MPLFYLTIGLGAAIFALNLLELIIITQRRRKIKTYEQLLSSLAVADALTGIFVFASKVYTVVQDSTEAEKRASNILSCIALTTVIISTASLASITADRLLAVKYPFYHRAWVTKSRVWFCAVIEWSITWVLVTIPILVGALSPVLPQDLTLAYQKITSWLLIICGVAFCVCYAELIRSLAKRPDFKKMAESRPMKNQLCTMQPQKIGEEEALYEHTGVRSGEDKSNKTEAIVNEAPVLALAVPGIRRCVKDGIGGSITVQLHKCTTNDVSISCSSGDAANSRVVEVANPCVEDGTSSTDTRFGVEDDVPIDDENVGDSRVGMAKGAFSSLRARALSINAEQCYNVKGERTSITALPRGSSVIAIKSDKSATMLASQFNGDVKKDYKMPKDSKKKELRLSRTVALTCALIIIIYLVCTTPYAVQIILGGDPLTGYSGFMLFSNSLLNPLVYFFKGYLENKIRKKEKKTVARNQGMAQKTGRRTLTQMTL